MTVKTRIIYFLPLLFLLLVSCKEEGLDDALFAGLWMQESITEDGQTVNLSYEEQNFKLLMESNGIYRSFTKDASVNPVNRYGTWMTTDNKWLDMSLDVWSVASSPKSSSETGTWRMNHRHTRFTVLSLTAEKMEIRIKTYVGEKKYAAMFVPQERPQITFDQVDAINKEFQTLKTYVFTFSKYKD
jgi:hypothetical protein